MKIIGIVPKQYEGNEVILLQATPDEVRLVLGHRWSRDLPYDQMRPGVEIKVDAIAGSNQQISEAVVRLKDLPQTLRALADILTREVKVLEKPTQNEAPKAG